MAPARDPISGRDGGKALRTEALEPNLSGTSLLFLDYCLRPKILGGCVGKPCAERHLSQRFMKLHDYCLALAYDQHSGRDDWKALRTDALEPNLPWPSRVLLDSCLRPKFCQGRWESLVQRGI